MKQVMKELFFMVFIFFLIMSIILLLSCSGDWEAFGYKIEKL
jgi:hypothetical protein